MSVYSEHRGEDASASVSNTMLEAPNDTAGYKKVQTEGDDEVFLGYAIDQDGVVEGLWVPAEIAAPSGGTQAALGAGHDALPGDPLEDQTNEDAMVEVQPESTDSELAELPVIEQQLRDRADSGFFLILVSVYTWWPVGDTRSINPTSYAARKATEGAIFPKP